VDILLIRPVEMAEIAITGNRKTKKGGTANTEFRNRQTGPLHGYISWAIFEPQWVHWEARGGTATPQTRQVSGATEA